MGKCGDCRWWSPDFVDEQIEPIRSACLHITTDESTDSKAVLETYTDDFEGACDARLMTLSDFGCVKFEPK